LKSGDREELITVSTDRQNKKDMRNNFKNDRERKSSDDSQLVYGIRPVMEAINAGKEIDRIFITRNSKGELMTELKSLLTQKNIPWQEVPIEKIHRITRNNHQDVVCFISSISYASLSNVLPGVFEKGETPLILVLDRITDVRNFGAIARTAECAGVHAIVIPFRGAAQVTADAIKTSAGALNRIPVCRENNLRDAFQYLRQSGLTIVAATEKGNEPYFNADLSGPLAIIMGSEEDGVSNDLLRTADKLLQIPLMGKISSLNVSVACGVMLFEAVRQRHA
jgi:23S rRNA (guanosine2251-2'-O)-methyltransferase